MFASQVHRFDTEPKDGANSIQLHGWRVHHTIVNFPGFANPDSNLAVAHI